jgi:hypothetical protein
MGPLQGDNKMTCLEPMSNEMDDATLRDDKSVALDQQVDNAVGASGIGHRATGSITAR